MNVWKWLSDRVYAACAAGFTRFAQEFDPQNPPPSFEALRERAEALPAEEEATAAKRGRR
jgi:hypothetical protein